MTRHAHSARLASLKVSGGCRTRSGKMPHAVVTKAPQSQTQSDIAIRVRSMSILQAPRYVRQQDNAKCTNYVLQNLLVIHQEVSLTKPDQLECFHRASISGLGDSLICPRLIRVLPRAICCDPKMSGSPIRIYRHTNILRGR